MRNIIIAEVIVIIALCLGIFLESSLDQSSNQSTASATASSSAEGSRPRRGMLIVEHKLSPVPQPAPETQPMPSPGPGASEEEIKNSRQEQIRQFEDTTPPNANPYLDCIMNTAPDMQQICDPLRECDDLNCRTEDVGNDSDVPQPDAPKSPQKRGRPPTPYEIQAEKARQEREEKVRREKAYDDCTARTPLNMQDICDPLKP